LLTDDENEAAREAAQETVIQEETVVEDEL
jgi:hypothetical protein